MRVAVVGAGFAGLLASYKLSALGFDVDLYEEHDRVGFPPHCTGIVSERVVDGIGRPALDTIQATYDYFVVRAGETSIRVRTRRPTYKLDRIRLEEKLLARAESQGAGIRLGVRVESVEPNGTLRVGSWERRYDMIILAEGLAGRLRDRLGIHYKPLTSRGLNIETPNPARQNGYFEVVFDESIGKGFAWRVPAGDLQVVGALTLDSPPTGAIERIYGTIRERIRAYGGRVIHGPPLARGILGRIIILGDAAGHNKPLTGGGLYPVTEIVTSAVRMVEEGVNLMEALRSSYARVASRLRRQHRIAKVLLGDPSLVVNAVEAAARAGLEEAVAGKIDYDYHEQIPRIALRSPLSTARAALRVAVRRPYGALRLLLAMLRALL